MGNSGFMTSILEYSVDFRSASTWALTSLAPMLVAFSDKTRSIKSNQTLLELQDSNSQLGGKIFFGLNLVHSPGFVCGDGSGDTGRSSVLATSCSSHYNMPVSPDNDFRSV